MLNKTHYVIVDFILAEAGPLGAAYRKAAEKTGALYLRLLALNQMLADQGSERRITHGWGATELICPSLNLKAFDDAGYPHAEHILFSLEKELAGSALAQAIESELERFKEAGVELF